ncbi:testis-specific protein TEX28 isoform 1-T1 [Discoglossus pictus]
MLTSHYSTDDKEGDEGPSTSANIDHFQTDSSIRNLTEVHISQQICNTASKSILKDNMQGEENSEQDPDIIQDNEPVLSSASSSTSVDQGEEIPCGKKGKSPLKKHRSMILHSWTALSKKSSFFKKIQEQCKDVQPTATRGKMSSIYFKFDSIKSSSWPMSSLGAISKAVSCPTVSSLPDNRQIVDRDPRRALRAHFKQRIIQLSEQLQVEEACRKEDAMEYFKLISKIDKHQAAQARIVFEKRNQRTAAAIAMIQQRLQASQRKLLELEQSHLRKQLGNLRCDRENKLGALQEHQGQTRQVDQSIRFDASQESTSDNALVELSTEPANDKDSVGSSPSSVEITSPQSGTPKTGSLDRKVFDATALMEEINTVKSRQEILANECLYLKEKILTEESVLMNGLKDKICRQ